MAITASPCGLGAIDLAGGRGIWPHAGGELWCALGMGTALVTAVTLTGIPDRVRRRPWAARCGLPRPPGRLRHLGGRDGRQRPADAARLQVLLTVAGPALLATTPAVLAVTAVLYVRAIDREDRLATRLVLLGVGGGLVARLLLGDIPQRITGEPLVPWPLLTLLSPRGARLRGGGDPALPARRDRADRPARPGPGPRAGPGRRRLHRPGRARWTWPPTSPSSRCWPVASSRCSCSRSPSPCSGPCAGGVRRPRLPAPGRVGPAAPRPDDRARGRAPGDAGAAGPAAPALLRRDRGLPHPVVGRDRDVDRRAARAARSPSTWWSAGTPSGGCCSRSTPAATPSGRATAGSSRTSAARSARSSRRCRSTASCSAPAST